MCHIHTHAKHTCNIGEKLTKKDAKCSDVITALNPTTGTKEANKVPKTTCNRKVMIWWESWNFTNEQKIANLAVQPWYPVINDIQEHV